MGRRKTEKADLRNRYPIFVQIGMVVALVILIAAFRVQWSSGETEVPVQQQEEVVEMEEVKQTQQQQKPPPPPKPPVPVEVPNDEVLEDENLDLDATLDFDEPASNQPPPEPPSEGGDEEEEPEVFVTVEQMPQLLPDQQTAMKNLSECATYTDMARRAGVEGRITVQFVVNEQGQVTKPRVIGEGLGAGLDKRAINCVKKLEFEPGQQRGEPVKVQFALPINFRLN